VAEIAEVEENATDLMETVRVPPVITINKTAAYALYELTYIRVRRGFLVTCKKEAHIICGSNA
jgi:hypothetical protein